MPETQHTLDWLFADEDEVQLAPALPGPSPTDLLFNYEDAALDSLIPGPAPPTEAPAGVELFPGIPFPAGEPEFERPEEIIGPAQETTLVGRLLRKRRVEKQLEDERDVMNYTDLVRKYGEDEAKEIFISGRGREPWMEMWYSGLTGTDPTPVMGELISPTAARIAHTAGFVSGAMVTGTLAGPGAAAKALQLGEKVTSSTRLLRLMMHGAGSSATLAGKAMTDSAFQLEEGQDLTLWDITKHILASAGFGTVLGVGGTVASPFARISTQAAIGAVASRLQGGDKEDMLFSAIVFAVLGLMNTKNLKPVEKEFAYRRFQQQFVDYATRNYGIPKEKTQEFLSNYDALFRKEAESIKIQDLDRGIDAMKKNWRLMLEKEGVVGAEKGAPPARPARPPETLEPPERPVTPRVEPEVPAETRPGEIINPEAELTHKQGFGEALTATKEAGIDAFKRVSAKPVKIEGYQDYNWLIYFNENNNQWTVIEKTTGRSVGEDYTRKEVIDKVKTNLDRAEKSRPGAIDMALGAVSKVPSIEQKVGVPTPERPVEEAAPPAAPGANIEIAIQQPEPGRYDVIIRDRDTKEDQLRVDFQTKEEAMTYAENTSMLPEEPTPIVDETEPAAPVEEISEEEPVEAPTGVRPTAERPRRLIIRQTNKGYFAGVEDPENPGQIAPRERAGPFDFHETAMDHAQEQAAIPELSGRPRLEIIDFSIEGVEPGELPPEEPGIIEPPKALPELKIAQRITENLRSLPDKGKLDPKYVQAVADQVYGGTMAEGKYTIKDLYDATELAVNLYIKDRGFTVQSRNPDVIRHELNQLEALERRLPTQTRRTEEFDEFQQFSTPPMYAGLVNWLAKIQESDTVLEPSAGTGSLAVFAKNQGAHVVANELSKRRADILRQLDLDQVFTENAEHINSILPKEIRPTVVLMNPPFSATAGRLKGQRATKNVIRHLEQALLRLEPGGRLVMIGGRGMSHTSPTFRDFWKKMMEEHTVRANVRIPGEVYKKYGTTFDSQLIVIDKVGPSKEDPITKPVENLYQALDLLKGVRDARKELEQPPGKPPVRGRPAPGGRPARPEPALLPTAGEVGPRIRPPGEGRPAPTGREPGPAPLRGAPPRGEVPEPGRPGVPAAERERPPPAGLARPGAPGREAERGGEQLPKVAGAVEPGVQVAERAPVKHEEELTDDLYEPYRPAKVQIPGAQSHPGRLVESAAMAAVDPPAASYSPKLPKETIESGALSEPQLEAIVYAGEAHQELLPDGSRHGFFLGDGTGVGKGREVAGIIRDNWNRGRKKALWISANRSLLKDAQRDVEGIGWDPNLVFDQGKIKVDDSIIQKRGILFTSYDTLRYKRIENQQEVSRLQQLLDWMGEDFDGVIIFDESHNMGNAIQISGQGLWGGKTPSLKALSGVELQQRVPNARIVYVSATGATEVSNLSYAERLGLWGEQTPFANKRQFIDSISAGGLATMELVARDLKARGLYMARNLAFKKSNITEDDDVQYKRVEHTLNNDQVMVYNKLAEAWQVVLRNFNEALGLTGQGSDSRTRAAVMSNFWSSHQRFFNQVITAMQMPTVITDAQKELDAGNAVILQLVNTNEAAQERALARLTEEQTLEELDITPRDQIMQLVEKGFPIQSYEDYTDEDGNVRSRPVTDFKGNPVIDPQAVDMRDNLLEALGAIRVPDGPLDIILNGFGVDNVAEVTGRHRRVVIGKDGKRIIQKRSRARANKDVEKFMQDKMHVLVFSEAGGTGRSYHADMETANKRKRIHYLIQPGWRADTALQGLGRTHRSNQATSPEYSLVTTNIKAQLRFISTIARRLDQLGALTKGQRQTGSQGFFQARDNLENSYAAAAVRLFLEDLYGGRIEGLEFRDFEQQTGLSLSDPRTGSLSTRVPPVRQFLNRLLSFNLDTMDLVFDAFSDRMDRLIRAAQDAGRLDIGLETVIGKNVRVVREQHVFTDRKSGAVTKYVELDVDHDTNILSWEEVKGYRGFVRNLESGRLWAIKSVGQRTDPASGEIYDQYLLVSPTTQTVSRADNENLLPLGKKEAEAEWSNLAESTPKQYTERLHLVTGILLPIWDRFPSDFARVVRIQTQDGVRMIGRLIPPEHLQETLHRIGAEASKIELSGDEILHRVFDQGASVDLANGWSIKKRLVSGEQRIEVTGVGFYDLPRLKEYGAFTERISWETRVFVPLTAETSQILEKIVEGRPIVSVTAQVRSGPEDGIELGFLGFTPQGMRSLYEGLISTGRFLYKNLPFGVKLRGSKLGITKEKFSRRFRMFAEDPGKFSRKIRDWFRQVWESMRTWWAKHKDRASVTRKGRRGYAKYIKEISSDNPSFESLFLQQEPRIGTPLDWIRSIRERFRGRLELTPPDIVVRKRDLPSDSPMTDIQIKDAFRLIKDVNRVSRAKAVEKLEHILEPLENAKDMALFERIVVTRDLIATANDDLEVPNGLTLQELQTEHDRLLGLADSRIRDSVNRHFEEMDAEGSDLVDRGKLEKQRQDYFPHVVLAYYQDFNKVGAVGPRLRSPFRPYTKMREGSEKPIKTDYVDTMVRHMAKVIGDNMIDDFQASVLKRLDITERLIEDITASYERQGIDLNRTQAKKLIRIPEGYAKYQPFPGNIFFTGNRISDQAAGISTERLMEELQKLVDAGQELPPNVRALLNAKDTLMVGRRRKTYIIPTTLAKQFTQYRKYENVPGFERLVSFLTNLWKWNVLVVNPKYQFKNLLGDNLNLFFDDAMAFTKHPQAFAFLFVRLGKKMGSQLAWQVPDKQLSAKLKTLARRQQLKADTYMELAQELSVIDSGFTGQEVAEIMTMPEFQRFTHGVIGRGWTGVKEGPKLLRQVSTTRENWARLAKFLKDLDRIEKGKKRLTVDERVKNVIRRARGLAPIVPHSVMSRTVDLQGLPEILAAGKASRAALLDYADFTKFENRYLRRGLIPFWAWWWGNLFKIQGQRIVRYPINYFMKLATVSILIYLWNHRDDEFETFEKTLPEWARAMPHVNVKIKGKIYALMIDAPWSDAAETIGLPGLAHLLDEDPDFAKMLNEAVRTSSAKFGSSLNFMMKEALEQATGQDFFTGYRFLPYKRKAESEEEYAKRALKERKRHGLANIRIIAAKHRIERMLEKGRGIEEEFLPLRTFPQKEVKKTLRRKKSPSLEFR